MIDLVPTNGALGVKQWLAIPYGPRGWQVQTPRQPLTVRSFVRSFVCTLSPMSLVFGRIRQRAGRLSRHSFQTRFLIPSFSGGRKSHEGGFLVSSEGMRGSSLTVTKGGEWG